MKVLVALSGGVDSSVAAALLLEEGHELVGITMKNWCYGDDDGDGRSCCSLESIELARSVANRLGFPHYVVDFEAPFETHVIRPFIREYVAGRTPNPCVACNAKVRFPGLWNRARAFGCEAFATGHYARIDRSTGRARVRRPKDASKDQSYVLWNVPADTLAHFLLPLGDLTKDEVRERAEERDLITAKRPDSQEICFVPTGDYGGFLEERLRKTGEDLPATMAEGRIVDRSGKEVGRHQGVARYTIGQRKGLGIAAKSPLYVIELRADSNEVVVGGAEEVIARGAMLSEVRFPEGLPDGDEMNVHVQLRSRHVAAPARVRRAGDHAEVEFAEPQRAITPGQSAVFYDGDRVLGGGVVSEARMACDLG